MRQNFVDLICIIVLLSVIIIVGIYFYKQFTPNEDDVFDIMLENVEYNSQNVENNSENVQEVSVPNKQVVQQYEIDGKEYEVVAVLNIPTLEIEYPVFSTTSKELLKVSLNKYWGPNPNEIGNFCIVGHNYNTDQFFGKLHNIKLGDYIQLTDMSGETMQYEVYDTYIVDPSNTDCTSQLTDGRTEITLITCTRNFKQRFVVKARVSE